MPSTFLSDLLCLLPVSLSLTFMSVLRRGTRRPAVLPGAGAAARGQHRQRYPGPPPGTCSARASPSRRGGRREPPLRSEGWLHTASLTQNRAQGLARSPLRIAGRGPQCSLGASGDSDAKRAHLREIEDVGVRDCEQRVDRASEGVDLLVRVPHEDLPTRLRQNDVHDRCNQRQAK